VAERSITDQTTGDITYVSAFDREVDGSEGASFSFTWSATSYLTGVILLVSGGVITASSTNVNASGTVMAMTKPGSPVAGDTLIVVLGDYDISTTVTPPSGWSSAVTAYDTHSSSASFGSTSVSLPDVTTAGSSGVLAAVQIGYNSDRATTPSGWTDVTTWDGVNRVWSKSVSASGSQGGPWSYTLTTASTAVNAVLAYTSAGTPAAVPFSRPQLSIYRM
jgi:hypothetical protein